MLKQNISLRTLNLSSNKLDDRGVVELGNCLEQNGTFHNLDLSHNWVTDKGAKALESGTNPTKTSAATLARSPGGVGFTMQASEICGMEA